VYCKRVDTAPAESAGRRPLKSRNVELFRALARSLALKGVTPNAISFASMVFAAAAAGAFVATWHVSRWGEIVCWLAAGVLIQLRLLANLLDGLVAVEGGKRGLTGELWNEAPDRVSDSLIFIGLGFASGSNPALGFSAALGAMFVAYTRVLGASLGAGMLFIGPMAKPQRMFLVTLLCVWRAIFSDVAEQDAAKRLASSATELYLHDTYYVVEPVFLSAVESVLAAILLGCAITAVRRLSRASAFLRERAQP